MDLPLYQLDAFASSLFAGNPAAVCPLEGWLPDATLQAIAAENNLSETAFFVRDGEGYRLRWFTPTVEVELCGHATLASGYVITRYLEPDCDEVRFETLSGPLGVMRQGETLTLDFPRHEVRTLAPDPTVAEALGAAPEALFDGPNLMAVFARESDVHDLAPDFVRLAALPAEGVIATAPGESSDFVSRYFAPKAGIPEDPVTGSTHCMLAPYWAERLAKTRLTARQISARGGELALEIRGERVLISGRVVPYLEGWIRL